MTFDRYKPYPRGMPWTWPKIIGFLLLVGFALYGGVTFLRVLF